MNYALPCCSPYHKPRSYHSSLSLVARNNALHLVYQDVGSFFAHLHTSLFNGGQHGVASHSTLSVGKPTDGDIVGHSEPHTLGSVQNANSRIVVDSKEAIGDIITLQQFRSDGLSIRTIVADAGNALLDFQTMFQEGILIAIETVLGNFDGG